MSEKQFFENLETLLLGWSITDKPTHDIVHNFHETRHFLFCEIFLFGEITIQVCELLQNCHQSSLLQRTVELIGYFGMIEPGLTNLLALCVRCGVVQSPGNGLGHLPVEKETLLSFVHDGAFFYLLFLITYSYKLEIIKI